MTQRAGAGRAGRPRDEVKGGAILDAGWSLFLERGVEATAIEAIAARAGVSKVTVYKHFRDKAALFEAAVAREMRRIEEAQRPARLPGGEHDGLHATLVAFGLGLMTFLTSRPAIDFYSVVAGELRRHPDLARAFHREGPGRTRENLAALIAQAAAEGQLTVARPEDAADALFGLWQGFTNFELALGIDVDGIRAGLPERVARGVAIFLAAYRRQPPTTPNGISGAEA